MHLQSAELLRPCEQTTTDSALGTAIQVAQFCPVLLPGGLSVLQLKPLPTHTFFFLLGSLTSLASLQPSQQHQCRSSEPPVHLETPRSKGRAPLLPVTVGRTGYPHGFLESSSEHFSFPFSNTTLCQLSSTGEPEQGSWAVSPSACGAGTPPDSHLPKSCQQNPCLCTTENTAEW